MSDTQLRRRGVWFLAAAAVAAAAVAGLVHAGFSAYWALGGDALLETVGSFAVELSSDGASTVVMTLWAVAALKAAGALVPLVDHLTFPAHRWVTVFSWMGVAVMAAWGAVGMAGGLIGLALGNRSPALLGHAFLWDPLFIAWAVFLGAGLVCFKRANSAAESSRGTSAAPTRRK